MLLSIVFSNDSSLLLKFIQSGVYQGLATAQGGCWKMHHLLAGELDSTFSFEVAFPLFIKRTMGSQIHVQRQEIALEVCNGTGPCPDPRAL